MMDYMVQMTVKLTARQKQYLDSEITKSRWASYSHAVRQLVEDHYQKHRRKKRGVDN